MAPTMEKRCGCVAEWREILGKGLQVNASISIVMVGCKAFVGYSESVYVVPLYERKASIVCTGYKKYNHIRCSGVHG